VAIGGWLGRLLERDWSGDEFSAALMDRKRVVNQVARFMDRYDFLLTPTAGCAAFGLGLEGPPTLDGQAVAPTAWLAFSAIANFTGLPAASVPVGFTRDGLPIGLQILGRHLDDTGVLALSAVLEALFPRRWPQISDARPWPN
jgi:aspartyl-tRNA(Asn)/glutamyl-tRNA(Gln) amidotransferase subunit A